MIFEPATSTPYLLPEVLRLLDGGAEAYPAMLAAIEQARTSVHLEMYAFSPTGVGAQFVAALTRASQRGVAGRIVIDGWGSARGGHGSRQRRDHSQPIASVVLHERIQSSPEAVEFYEFTRTMRSYKTVVGENTTVVMSTDSDLFKFLKGMSANHRVTTNGQHPRRAWMSGSAANAPEGEVDEDTPGTRLQG
jgi:hypothetical protein